MYTHSLHPDTTAEYILYDRCARCHYLAENFEGLDVPHFRWAWQKMLYVEGFMPEGSVSQHYASRNEAELCKRLYQFALQLERCGLEAANLLQPNVETIINLMWDWAPDVYSR